MASGSASKRYAQAIFQIAVERNQLDEWYADLQRIRDVVGTPEMRQFLLNAGVTRAEKRRVALATILGLSPMAQNLVQLLVERERLVDGPQILADYEAMMFEHKGIARARVTTAVPLSPEEEALVARQLKAITGKDIILTAEVDQSIIGGVIARIGDKLLDGSTRTKLQELKLTLAGQQR